MCRDALVVVDLTKPRGIIVLLCFCLDIVKPAARANEQMSQNPLFQHEAQKRAIAIGDVEALYQLSEGPQQIAHAPRTSSFHWEWKFQLPVSAHWAWSISVVRIRPITPSVITKGGQS